MASDALSCSSHESDPVVAGDAWHHLLSPDYPTCILSRHSGHLQDEALCLPPGHSGRDSKRLYLPRLANIPSGRECTYTRIWNQRFEGLIPDFLVTYPKQQQLWTDLQSSAWLPNGLQRLSGLPDTMPPHLLWQTIVAGQKHNHQMLASTFSPFLPWCLPTSWISWRGCRCSGHKSAWWVEPKLAVFLRHLPSIYLHRKSHLRNPVLSVIVPPAKWRPVMLANRLGKQRKSVSPRSCLTAIRQYRKLGHQTINVKIWRLLIPLTHKGS